MDYPSPEPGAHENGQLFQGQHIIIGEENAAWFPVEGQIEDAAISLFVRISNSPETESEFLAGVAGKIGEFDPIEFGNEVDHGGDADSFFQIVAPQGFQAGYVFLVGFEQRHLEKPLLWTAENAPNGLFNPTLRPMARGMPLKGN